MSHRLRGSISGFGKTNVLYWIAGIRILKHINNNHTENYFIIHLQFE